MTRIDTVRHAADVTKDSVRHAAEVAAPYANTAKEGAVHYGRQAGEYGRHAGALARQTYDARLAARVGQARDQAWAAVPPKAATAVETAALRSRKGARAATAYTVPKAAAAVAVTRLVAGPLRDETVLRSSAALHAVRGRVTAEEIDRLVLRRMRRQKAGRAFRGMVILGLAGGAAFSAWKWWSKQTHPDWLVEQSEPADADERSTLTVVDPLEESQASVNGSTPRVNRVDGSPDAAGLDPEAEARQAERDRREDDEDE